MLYMFCAAKIAKKPQKFANVEKKYDFCHQKPSGCAKSNDAVPTQRII